MKNIRITLSFVALSLGLASLAAAQPVVETRGYSSDGEISPGTTAPRPAQMVSAIQNGSPEKMRATLEYGERVVCEDCVPLLEAKLLESSESRVREMSAWWLRRQPFAAPIVLGRLRKTVKSDASAVRRARAAEALGEFMDPFALPELSDAATEDKDASVRIAAVKALARLNSEMGFASLSDALKDSDSGVKVAVLEVLTDIGTFRDFDALIPLLGDKDAGVRTRAARVCGEYRVRVAQTALVAMLEGDESAPARKAAAAALGRIGGADGHSALLEAKDKETEQGVLDAIQVALRMPVRF